MSPGAATTARHLDALRPLGIDEPACLRLASYLDLIAAWSERINLTGARTPAERVRVLVEPVFPVARDLVARPLLDVGSGNGSPGLVLGLMRPEIGVTLLEPRTKRWAFLREAARLCGRADIDARKVRAEEYVPATAVTVTVRGLRLDPSVALRLLAAGGELIVFGDGLPDSPEFERMETPPAWPTDVRRWRSKRPNEPETGHRSTGNMTV